ncbi:DUF4241 domain-containing protein [Chitinophaga sancti]|uniref:DUF4241 domain-containing protein n=1 Tax=Chitinophaga sancti TaxID=1004 RepID=UPI002A74E605|nr:DUF4241 domain-containing protein [Chitinophaga sancti]WPQ62643.1 DUF4241 domain-containing protein [Chitinophaga sancti]
MRDTQLSASATKEMEESYKNTWSWLMKEFDGHTIALLSSGWGDGFNAGYIGYDKEGKIGWLVTDFGMIGGGVK